MIKILDSDQNPWVRVLTAGCDPLLQQLNVVKGQRIRTNPMQTNVDGHGYDKDP